MEKKERNEFYEDFSEVVHRQCEELKGWRDKYRELEDKYKCQIAADEHLASQVAALKKEKDELTVRIKNLKIAVSNAEYEAERSVSAIVYNELSKKHDALMDEMAEMSHELVELRKKLDGAEKACEKKAAELREALAVSGKKNNMIDALHNELKRQRDKADTAIFSVNKCREEVIRLKKRGLWARITNK